MTYQEDRDRYFAALHAMQTGVAYKMEYDESETSPKHIRVGINSAMVETGVMQKILVDKGILTKEELAKELADGMEREVMLYTKWLRDKMGGANIDLA